MRPTVRVGVAAWPTSVGRSSFASRGTSVPTAQPHRNGEMIVPSGCLGGSQIQPPVCSGSERIEEPRPVLPRQRCWGRKQQAAPKNFRRGRDGLQADGAADAQAAALVPSSAMTICNAAAPGGGIS